jgi:hypothetical protein
MVLPAMQSIVRNARRKNGDKKSHIISTYIVEKGKPLASPA